MRNWKELGEIPDSEAEDGFDSQSIGSQETILPKGNENATEVQNGDVWDVPLSQGEAATAAMEARTTTKRLPDTGFAFQESQSRDLWAVPLSQELDELALGHHARSDQATPPPDTTEPLSSPLSTLSSISFNDLSRPSTLGISGEIDPQESPRRQRTPVPTFIDMTEATPFSTPSRILAATTPVVSSELGERESEYVARQAAVRYERSLRARKPIQQHPFLLEAAQYRTSMQSRGLKPLRIAAMQIESRRKDQETQETPYEPESQDSNGDEGSGSRQMGSQVLGDFDDWAFPSSSPPSPPRAPRVSIPSSQTGSLLETDSTSVHMDDFAGADELPALEDLLSHPRRPSNKYTPKRRPTSPRTSSKKKQRRLVLDSDDVLPPARTAREDLPDSLQDAQGALPPSSSFEPVPNFLLARSKSLKGQHHSTQPQRSKSPATPDPIPDAMVIDSGSESEDQVHRAAPEITNETDNNESESDGGEKIVSTVGRTIRGVLPASWLRLDQQSGRDKIRKAVTSRAVLRSPERDQRRGVAQKRKGNATTSLGNDRIWSDESEAETPTRQQATTDDAFPNQTRLMVNEVSDLPGPVDPYYSDDDGFGMEDNQIDHMLAPRQRQMKLAESFQAAGKRQSTPQSVTKACPKKALQQPRITSALSGVNEPSPSALRVTKQHRKRNRANANGSSHRTSESRRHSGRRKASALGILDVIEPDAPRFLRIAARTARQRPSQGRGSPTHKAISLANREDHVDALSVLHQWRAGAIPQRATVTSSVRKRGGSRRSQPLTETSGNQDPYKAARPLRKANTGQNPVQASTDAARQGTMARSMSSRSVGDHEFRQAQLETSESDPRNSRSFYTGKRALDKLFRRPPTAQSTVGVLSVSDDIDALDESPVERPKGLHKRKQRALQSKVSEKSRYRKQAKPTRENLDAPQFVHAHDPLPRRQDAVDIIQPVEPQGSGVRMSGLGPYGTEYTHHFEIFPLLAGVYFHETSLIGRGILASIADHPITAVEDISRTRLSYTLGDQNLRWGPWSEHVSSELGILFDFITEKLEDPGAMPEASAAQITKAADFVLSYVKDHMSFHQASDTKAFFTRFHEVLCGFNDKVKLQLQTTGTVHGTSSVAMQRTFERVLLAALCVVQICRNEPSFVNEQIQAEDMLKAIATTTVSMLMRLGTNELRQAYGSLSSARAREKGLREEGSTIHSWVTVMKVLDEARLLRASFWDIVQANLTARDYIGGHDAEKHDLLWQDLFSFLPLVEFNNMGVLMPGSRHEVVHEGWGLPQKLLRNVLQLYRENPRQPPSFNNYCRALVARCHYLVEQWGWRKSSSVVGVIFDFFGSQNLAHLRNEEVYKSPRFLEDLSSNPRLEIEPEDRCFHVFLKLVALSILRLRDVDATKDIRNLVARTMPNHSRHYLKEQNLHQRDLAALRNHHDLLCTLFWACPPDLRPSAAIIEGLVDPASSHKETCLISLRSWSQLARFLVNNGEASIAKVFGPFVSWRDGFFGKMLQQYSSIASEINQQFHSLAKEERQGVSDDMLKAMVSANKIAVQDVLHFSVTASYDVMMQCPDLEPAVWSLSTKQLQQVFDHFSAAPPELDWSILTVTLKTLGAFLAKIDEFKDAEESQQRESQVLDSEQADDALQTLDECVAKKYFAMARCVLSNRGEGDKLAAVNVMDKAACKELVITLSSKFASRLVSSGSMRLGQLFKYNKYGLFDAATLKLDLEQRRYLVLCILSLLKSNTHDFSDAGFTLLDVWMLAIVKPREGLCWENQLADQLQSIGTEFIPEAATGLAVQPHYHSNRDMFEFAISYMRNRVREAESSQKKGLVSEYAQTLKMVMAQMMSDLKTVSWDLAEHPAYVSFVRGIISLIRSHGADICAVDDFYYQISKDYSPPAEDPQLQVAGMIGYELKLNDPGARQQLFFFMFNSFKLAMNKDELGQHTVLLWKGIKRPAVRRFVLGKLLAAALRAAWQQPPAHVFVDFCMDAFEQLLAGSILSTDLQLDDLNPLLSTIAAIVSGFHQLSAVPSTSEVHLINRTLAFMNLVWPSLLIMTVRHIGAPQLEVVRDALKAFKSSFHVILRHLELANGYPYWETSHLLRASLRHVARPDAPDDADVASFRDNIVADVERNWNVGEKRIGIKTPAKSTQSSTQIGQGVKVPERDVTQLYLDMKALLAIWIDNYEELFEDDTRERKNDAPSAHKDLVF